MCSRRHGALLSLCAASSTWRWRQPGAPRLDPLRRSRTHEGLSLRRVLRARRGSTHCRAWPQRTAGRPLCHRLLRLARSRRSRSASRISKSRCWGTFGSPPSILGRAIRPQGHMTRMSSTSVSYTCAGDSLRCSSSVRSDLPSSQVQRGAAT